MHVRVGPNLPSWVKERGVKDATRDATLIVTLADIERAIGEKAMNDGSCCVMTQSCVRLGAQQAYFYKTAVYVDWGDGAEVERFTVPVSVRRMVIDPFDHGDFTKIQPGRYELRAPKGKAKLGRGHHELTGTEPQKRNRGVPKPAELGRLVQASKV